VRFSGGSADAPARFVFLGELSGGVPLLANPGANSQTLSWDAIAHADPDVVIVVPCGFDLARAQSAAAELTQNPVWNGLRAVASGHAYAMNGDAYVNRPGPRLIDSAERFAWCFHDAAIAPQPSGITRVIPSGCPSTSSG
jgi:iron complex transport system substrate-binding protein